MARTAIQISQQIRAQLGILDPDISLEPLTPERKIVDTVAEVISEAEIDKYVLDYQYDIDTKVGSDLDKFVALFGFARQGGRRATGYITLGRSSAPDRNIYIPAGSQVIKLETTVSPAVTFQTVTAAVMYAGTTTVVIPIECIVTGPVGNVPAATITTLGMTGIAEISTVTNAAPTSGGTDDESDAELRVRFKNTVFRNVVGTQDQYLALAIASRFANKANVIGPMSRFIEYLQIASAAATSQIPYSKYTYNYNYFLTDGQTAGETFYTPRGVDYTFTNAVPPTLAVNNSTSLPNTTVVLLEHEYCSSNSRNDPANNILNYIDVYVSGLDAATAYESTKFPASGQNFNNTSSSAYYASNFARNVTGVTPTIGNRFQELLWQPVTVLPATITVATTTYTLNTDYWLVKDITNYKGSFRARNGIEWTAAAATAIGTGASFTYSYTFDKLPLTLNELMEAHKQITTDILVHSATNRYFNINLTVMYSPGFSGLSVDQAITVVLTDFLARQQFGSVIQMSDILEIVHEVPGVDNVRLTASTESVTYGIQEVGSDGITTLGSPYTNDFALQDSDLPVLNKINTLRRSQNTWSS